MHNFLRLLLVFMLFFVTSCSKEEANVENNVNDEHQIKNNHSNVLNSNEIGDIIAIDGLKEINISDINIFDSKYYRNGLNINLNENLLNKKITISLENGKEWINISEVVLEPLKLTADNKAESVIFSLDNLGTIKAKDIDDETIKLFSKYIPINTTLEIGNEIETKINMPKDTMASIWFYPICYKVTYNDKDYHILKIANKINDESIIKPVSDGIIEIRIQQTK